MGLQSVAQKVTRTLASVGAGLSAGLAIRGVLQTGASFEKVMSEVAARTKATTEEFKSLTSLAEELGRSTIFDNDAAGRAMVELSKAGFSVTEIMSSVTEVLGLAAADNLDLAEAAAITAGAIKKFELDAADAGRVVDVLAKGAGSALTDVSSLGEQLAYAAGPAREAGYSIESTVAALAALSDKVDKSMAGTGLRQVISGLAKPAAEAQQTLDKLGITVTDAAGNFRPLADIVDDFNAALGGMASGDKLRTLSTIFETRTANAFAGLMSAGGDELRRLTGELERSQGEAARLAAQMTDNVSGAFTSMMSAIKGAATDFFQTFAEPLKNGLKGVAEFITGPFRAAFNYFANNIDLTPAVGAIAGIVAAGAGLASVSLAFKAMQVAAIPLIAIGGQIGRTYVAASRSISIAFAGVRQIGSGIDVIFVGAFSRIVAAASALRTAVVARFVAMRAAAIVSIGPIGAAFAAMFAGIRIAAGGAATAVRGIGMAAAQVAAGVFGLASIVAAPLVLIGGAIAGVMLASEKGVSALKAGWASVSANFEHIAIQIQKTFTAAFDLVVRIGVKALNALGIQFDTSGSDILDSFNEKMQGLGDWIEDALIDVQFFFENFETYFDLGIAYVNKWAAGVTARISELFTKDLPTAIAKGMIQIADTFGGNSLFEKFLGVDAASMKQGAELILQAQAIGRGFTGGMRPMSDAERAAQGRINEISKGLGGDLEAFRWQQKIDTEFKAAMSSIDDAIKNGIPTAGDMAAASDAPNTAADSASGIPTGVQAMNERQGPGVALRGSQDAFDVINRAIRGSKQDQQHKETIGVLNQIAAKEPVVLEVAEI